MPRKQHEIKNERPQIQGTVEGKARVLTAGCTSVLDREAKVGHLGAPSGIDQDVVGLEIAVNNFGVKRM